jgi:MFS transporter, DHA2 family, methylenomycin A resistance protein
MPAARPPQRPGDGRAGERGAERTAVLAALLAGVLAPLNSTMIVVALPEVLADLGAPLAWGSWIIVSYLVAMAAVQPVGGSLGDRFGRRRIMLLGLAGFTLASLVAALATSVEMLVLARTVQAITGASAIPNGTALVRVSVAGARLGRAFGIVGVGIGVAAAVGPPLGGIVTDALGWRWIFAANLLVLVPGLVLVARLPRAAARAPSGRFDALGSVLLLATLVGAALSATVWRVPGVTPALTPLLAVVALLSGSAFVRRSRRVPDPVLQLDLLRRPGFLPAGLTVATSNLVMYTVFLALPLFLARLNGWGPRDVGWVLGSMSVAMLAWGPIGGALGDRLGRRVPALAGTALAAVATLPFLAIAPTWPWWGYAAAVTLLGSGIGLSSASVQAAAMRAAGTADAGQAAGLFSAMRYAGSIVGTAVLAAVLGEAASATAYRWLFAVVALVALSAVASAARLPARSGPVAHREHVAEER